VLVTPDYLDDPVEGEIVGLSLHSGHTPNLSGVYYDNDIYIGYTDLDRLTSNFDDNFGSYSRDLVFTADTLALDWTYYAWQDYIDFDTVWYYDGASNFIVEFTYDGDDDDVGNNARGWSPPGGNLALDAYGKYAETGDLVTFSNWIKFRICPSAGAGVEAKSLGNVKSVFR
jgi:hypothetical protein